jgi:adenylate cyclase
MWFHRAVESAAGRRSPTLGLRAALKLSRFWSQRNQIEAARNLLASIYVQFTEGFATSDLREAKALLDEFDERSPR